MACVIKNCKSHRGIKNAHGKYISFHKFPTEQVCLSQWIDATGREPDWTPRNHHTVCSEHFTSECFMNAHIYTKHRKLFDSAVPTLNLPNQCTKQENLTPNMGGYPTLLIEPLTPKCTEPSLTPNSKPPAKARTIKQPLFVIDKKTDCNKCQLYRGQLHILKKKVEHLEQVARKRFLTVNALRQKAMRLEATNTELYKYIENNLESGKKMVNRPKKKHRHKVGGNSIECDNSLLVVKDEEVQVKEEEEEEDEPLQQI